MLFPGDDAFFPRYQGGGVEQVKKPIDSCMLYSWNAQFPVLP